MAVTTHGHIVRQNGGFTETFKISALTGQTVVSVHTHMAFFLDIHPHLRPTAGTVPTEILYAVQDATDPHIVKVWSSDNASVSEAYLTVTGY